jgi:hypothetical protein
MTNDQLAERVARHEYGDGWADLDERTREMRIEIWSGLIEAIRAAGLEIVEAEDGR